MWASGSRFRRKRVKVGARSEFKDRYRDHWALSIRHIFNRFLLLLLLIKELPYFLKLLIKVDSSFICSLLNKNIIYFCFDVLICVKSKIIYRDCVFHFLLFMKSFIWSNVTCILLRVIRFRQSVSSLSVYRASKLGFATATLVLKYYLMSIASPLNQTKWPVHIKLYSNK